MTSLSALMARHAQSMAIGNPKAQAIIVGPVAEPPRRVYLTPLEAHFFMLDSGDD